MMTEDGLLWRLKYFLALVAIFAATSFAPPPVPCADDVHRTTVSVSRDSAAAACAARDTAFARAQLRLSDSREP